MKAPIEAARPTVTVLTLGRMWRIVSKMLMPAQMGALKQFDKIRRC